MKKRFQLRRSLWLGAIATPVAIAVALAAALVPGNSSQTPVAQAGSGPQLGVEKKLSDSKRALDSSVANYWTKERMENAKPVPMKKSREPKSLVAGDTATGPAGTTGGVLDAPKSLIEPGAAASPRPTTGKTSTGVLPMDGGYPGPNTTWAWFGKYRRYPVSTVGKIFFTKPGGGNFVCSGAVTYGGTGLRDDVWTAGHCVAGGGSGSYYTNIQFCPSYNAAGVNPGVGCYTAFSVIAAPEWLNNGAFTRDYARIVTNTCSSINVCTEVGDVVGTLGFSWNFPRDQHWMDFGYPQASPYDGTKIITTAAEHRYDDQPDGFGPATNSIGSPQTGGTSGGPWIQSFSGQGGFINSVNSYGYDSQPGQLYGPYNDTVACQRYTAWVGGGC